MLIGGILLTGFSAFGTRYVVYVLIPPERYHYRYFTGGVNWWQLLSFMLGVLMVLSSAFLLASKPRSL